MKASLHGQHCRYVQVESLCTTEPIQGELARLYSTNPNKSRKTPLANFASALPVNINQSLDGSKQLGVRVECRKLFENISHHLIDFHSEGYRVFLLSIDAHILVLICFCTSSKCFVYLRKRNFQVRVQCLNKDVGSASSSLAGLLISRIGVLRRLNQTNRLLQ